VLIIVGDLHRGVVRAVQYAKTLAAPTVAVRAVFVETDPAKTAKLEEKWTRYGLGVPLVILNSPYRSLLRPLVETSTRCRRRATAMVTWSSRSSCRRSGGSTCCTTRRHS